MNILLCVKQVPDTADIRIDPCTNGVGELCLCLALALL